MQQLVKIYFPDKASTKEETQNLTMASNGHIFIESSVDYNELLSPMLALHSSCSLRPLPVQHVNYPFYTWKYYQNKKALSISYHYLHALSQKLFLLFIIWEGSRCLGGILHTFPESTSTIQIPCMNSMNSGNSDQKQFEQRYWRHH